MLQLCEQNVTFRKNVCEAIGLIFNDSKVPDELAVNIEKIYAQFGKDWELLTRAKKFVKSTQKGLQKDYPSEKLAALEKKVQRSYDKLIKQLSGEKELQLRCVDLFETFK